ncbi:MAG: hypothetical protein R2784_01140 [Saprospiraceae bacterium]
MEKLEHLNAWELDHRLETAMDALRCPDGNAQIKSYPEEKEGELLFVVCC